MACLADVKDWPSYERFSPAFCRRERLRWSIHPHRISDRAGIHAWQFIRWERNGWPEAPVGLPYMIYTALRQAVAERALRALVVLHDVREAAERRIAYEAVAAEYRAAGRKPPKPPKNAQPPAIPDLPGFLS